jgi:hypothetical protein
MNKLLVFLGAIISILPSIQHLTDLRYRHDSRLEYSVCRSLLCSDQLLVDSADRLAYGSTQDKNLAVANLQEALRRNVADPNQWTALGEALFEAGRLQEAQYCFGRAVALGPQNPAVLWRTAQFFARIQKPIRREQYMAKMLGLVPEYKTLVFDTYASSNTDVVEAFQYGIPEKSPLANDYFQYLLRNNARLADIRKAWNWLQRNSPADDRLAGDYVDWLIARHEYALASETWANSVGGYDHEYLHPNAVFNGGFERPPLQSGLDWRWRSQTSGVEIARDSAVAANGTSSLRIQFDGTENVDFHSVAHDVVVSPGRYHFKAWLRTSDVSTDQGVGLRIIDSAGHINLETKRLTGTHDWTPVELDFTISGATRLLRIEVVRQASWKFDNKISGQVWIDNVSLVRL